MGRRSGSSPRRTVHVHPPSDQQLIEKTHNLARYFTEWRQVGWVLLIATLAWGLLGYQWMPKAKDPSIPIRVAAAVCIWPGASAERIEQQVTKRMEAVIAENTNVETITSNTRSSVVVIYILLKDGLTDIGKVFDDIALRLNTVKDLPQGAGPIQFIKDFGDTAALMLTVGSPKVSEVEIDLRSRAIRTAIEEARQGTPPDQRRATILSTFPTDADLQSYRRLAAGLTPQLEELGRARDFRFIEGAGFLGVDLELTDQASDKEILAGLQGLLRDRTRLSEIHPDVWPLTMIRNPAEVRAKLTEVAGDKYSYRQLDEYTDTIRRRLQAVPLVAKVTRSGVLPEQVLLEYSQNRLAALGVKVDTIDQIIAARNISMPGGIIEIDQKNITIDPSGQLASEAELGDLLVGATEQGLPLYLRDVVSVERTYDSPARFLNYLTVREPSGDWRRNRAITVALQMRAGGQIADFAQQVDEALAEVQELLPDDLVLRRTSDQPLQVKENVSLFMSSLFEAIVLVVLVALIGFWEWRSALLMALSIPITLAMTFGMMAFLKLDIQQVSIASLIIALGLLVDDPVVAGDAIKRSLADGHKPIIAAWLGPTKLATAILFATITNIVAYLPFLALSGETGQFLYTLPVVLTCSLVASRIASMTFIPLLGYYLLRPAKNEENVTDRKKGFARVYAPLAEWALRHRKLVLAGSLVPMGLAMFTGALIQPSFFPKDEQYLAYVDIWLAEDAPLSATQQVAFKAEDTIIKVASRRAGAGERQAHRPAVGGADQGRRDAGTPSDRREDEDHLPQPPFGGPDPGRLGRRELLGEADGRPGSRELRRRDQPGRRLVLGGGDERRARRHAAGQTPADPDRHPDARRGAGPAGGRAEPLRSRRQGGEGAGAAGLAHRLLPGDREDPAQQPLPHDHRLLLPDGRRAPVRDPLGDHAANRRTASQLAARLSHRDRRRIRGAEPRLRRAALGLVHLGLGDLHRPGHPIQIGGEAADGLRLLALRRGGRLLHPLGDGGEFRLHGLPRGDQPDRGDRQSHHRALRLDRGAAGARRAAARGPGRRRHPADPPGVDHRRGDRARLGASGPQRWAVVGAALLRPDRRPDHRLGPHLGVGAGPLRGVRLGSQVDPLAGEARREGGLDPGHDPPDPDRPHPAVPTPGQPDAEAGGADRQRPHGVDAGGQAATHEDLSGLVRSSQG